MCKNRFKNAYTQIREFANIDLEREVFDVAMPKQEILTAIANADR